MLRQMARPRPVPPFWRESEASTCWKRSKIDSSLSAGMPRPSSATLNSDVAVDSARRQRDDAAGRRELDGVRQQVRQRLHDAVGVGPHDALDLAPGRPRRRPRRRRGTTTRRLSATRSATAHALLVQHDGARLDALDVEDVVDQPDQAVGVLDRDLDHPPPAFGELADGAAGEQAERAADRRQRRAQLVADDGHELVLHPVDLVAVGDVAEHGDRAAARACRRAPGSTDSCARNVVPSRRRIVLVRRVEASSLRPSRLGDLAEQRVVARAERQHVGHDWPTRSASSRRSSAQAASVGEHDRPSCRSRGCRRRPRAA